MNPAARAALAALLALAAPALPAAPARAEGGKEAPRPEAPKEQFKDEVQVAGARAPATGVEVVYEGWDRVDWKAKSGPAQSKPGAEVLSVKYGDQPTPFTRGMDLFRTGRWADAEVEFRGVASAVSAGKARKFWEARANAYIGECRRRQAAMEKSDAKFKEAAESFQEAARGEPKGPLAEMIQIGLAEALAGAKDWDGASRVLDEFRKAAVEAGRPAWEARTRLARGRILEAKGEPGSAAQEYEELARAAQQAASRAQDPALRAALEEYRVSGLVSQGWALFARAEKTSNAADLDAARKAFDALGPATGGAPAGRAAAMNGIGAILLLEGKPWKALERFVEVEVTMYQVPDEVARALWYKAETCRRLGNSAGREQAFKDLSEFHPESEWASRAR